MQTDNAEVGAVAPEGQLQPSDPPKLPRDNAVLVFGAGGKLGSIIVQEV